MAYKLQKMSRKYLATSALLLSLILSNFLPIFASRAEAQFAVTAPVLESMTVVENSRKTFKDALDSAAMIAARLAIQQIVNSTVRWAQSGFDGNPAYAVDPKKYFTDLADGVAVSFIEGTDLEFLCSPFQVQVKLALQNQHTRDARFQCTLTEVVGNIEAFYGDFSQGGWDGWFAMTQNSSNNPYGAYIDAQVELDTRIASVVGLEREQLAWNQGFLSVGRCIGVEVLNEQTGQRECLGSTQIVTPGATIKSQLDKVLPSGIESLITVNHVEQLIQAFATGLLQKYVFGSQGLFDKSSSLPTDQPNSSTGGGSRGVGGGVSGPPPAPTYAQCVASCTAAEEQGIDVQSCIAAACAPLTQQ